MEEINTFSLLLGFLGIWIIAYLAAWIGRDEYDFVKVAKLYALIGGGFCLLMIPIDVNWFLAIGLFIFGFIVLIFRNQHYFDKE
ncbi:hypothetical protein BN1356_01599 [Streptococcus varani]|uniref:Uncharacterized protein n=1 Tax=Streptococcus varani TaxID=1608583 RepID=A0A0E4H5E2_9STRE|nr:hypothetical protein [Streptococcus varani]CQR25258.1 hypothetical protein BN1356_01599 [Streptococcus varani]